MTLKELKFITGNGTLINLEYPFKFHTIFPALSSMNITNLIKKDKRFEYIETIYKNINGYKIEYCKVSITDKCKFESEKIIHDQYKGKICYLSVVSSKNEQIIPGDLEPSLNIRAVLVPEKINL